MAVKKVEYQIEVSADATAVKKIKTEVASLKNENTDKLKSSLETLQKAYNTVTNNINLFYSSVKQVAIENKELLVTTTGLVATAHALDRVITKNTDSYLVYKNMLKMTSIEEATRFSLLNMGYYSTVRSIKIMSSAIKEHENLMINLISLQKKGATTSAYLIESFSKIASVISGMGYAGVTSTEKMLASFISIEKQSNVVGKAILRTMIPFGVFFNFDGGRISKALPTINNYLGNLAETLQNLKKEGSFLNKFYGLLSNMAMLGAKGIAFLSFSIGGLEKIISNVVVSIAGKMKDFTSLSRVAFEYFPIFATSVFSNVVTIAQKFISKFTTIIQIIPETIISLFINAPKTISGIFSNIINSVNGILSKINLSSITNIFNNSATKIASGMNFLKSKFVEFSTIFFSIGYFMSSSDNPFIKISGYAIMAVAVIKGKFLPVIQLLGITFADTLIKIGGDMWRASAYWTSLFVKNEAVINRFNQTLNSLELGNKEELKAWGSLVNKITDSSILSKAATQEMVTEIIHFGQTLGLTKEQLFALAQAIPKYANSSEDLKDVTFAVMGALAGSTQEAEKYGISLSSAAVENAKFMQGLGVTLDALSENEKAQGRLGAFLEQSEKLVGRATSAMYTSAGAAIYFSNKLDQIRIRLGETNSFLVWLEKTLARLSISFSNVLDYIPNQVLSIAGTFYQLGGALLVVIGTLAKYSILISGLVVLFKFLNYQLGTNNVLQYLLTIALTKTSMAMGGQAIAVTSLSTLMLGLARITGTLLIASFKQAILGIGTLIKSLYALSVALLTNPLFLTASGIIVGLALLYKGFVLIEKESGVFSRVINDVKRSFNETADASFSLKQQFQNVLEAFTIIFDKLARVTAIFTVTITNAFVGVTFAAVQLLKILTFSNVFKDNKVAKNLNDMEDSLLSFNEALNKTQQGLASKLGEIGFAEVALGATNTQKEIQKIREELIRAKSEFLSEDDKTKIQADIFGGSFAVLGISKKLAEENILVAKEIDEKRKLAAELYKIDLEMVKNIRDASKQADDAMLSVRENEASRTASIKNIIEASRIKLQKDLEPLLSQLDNLAFAPSNPDVVEARKKIDDAIVALTKENLAKQKADIEKFNDDKKKAQAEALVEFAKLTKNETVLANYEAQKQVEQFKKYAKDKNISAKQQAEALNLIEKNRLDRIAQARKDIEDTIEANTLDGAKTALDNLYNTRQMALKDYLALQQSMQESALVKEQENYLKSLKDKGVTGDAYLKAELDAFATTEEKKKQISIDNEKKILDARRASLKEFDTINGTQANTLLANYDEQIQKLKELQAQGSISSKQAEGAKSKLDVKKGFELPAAKAADALSPVSNFATSMSGAMETVAGAAGSIVTAIAKIPQIFDGLIDMVDGALQAWLDFPTKIFDKFMASNEKLMQFPQKFLDNLGNALPKISGYLTKSIVDTVPRLIGSFIRGIPKLITGLIQAIPAVVDAFIDGIISSFTSIGDAFKSFVDPENWKLGEAATQAIDAVGKSVTGVGSQLFGFVEQSGVSQAQEQAKNIRQASKEGSGWFMKAWEQLKNFGKWVANLIGSSIMAGVNLLKSTMDFLANLFATIATSIIATLEQSVTFISEQFSAIWELGKATFDTIIESFKWVFVDIVWGLVLKPFVDMVQWVFVDIVWKLVLKPAVDLFMAMWDFVVTLFDDPVKAFKDLWESIKNIFADAWANLLGAFTKLGDIFSGIWDKMKTAFSDAVAILGNFFGSIKTYVVDAFSSVINFFSDLGGTIWNGIKSAWGNVKTFFTDLFTFTPSEGKVEKWLGFDFPWVQFAKGGYVQGNAKVAGDSLKNDTVPALLSAGEYILPRSVTQNKDLMALIMAIINSNKKVEKHATGGGIGDFFSKAGSTIWEGAKSVGSAVVEGAKWVGDLLVPDWIQELWDSLSRYVSNINFKEFVQDPLPTAEKALKGSFSFIKDLMLPDVKKLLGFAQGGLVGNGTDTVPAMLTQGEFVVSRPAVQQYGVGALNALNKGMLGGGSTNNTTNNIELTLNFKTEQPIDEKYVKNVMMPTIKDELRRLSLDGRRVLATSGVR